MTTTHPRRPTVPAMSTMTVLAVAVLAIHAVLVVSIVITVGAVRASSVVGPWAVPAVASRVATVACAPKREDSKNTESNRECNHERRPFENQHASRVFRDRTALREETLQAQTAAIATSYR